MVTTLLFDDLSLGATTIYLSVLNDSIFPTYGEYFSFLSLDAQDQQYWYALTLTQHFIANNYGISTLKGKSGLLGFGLLKIWMTYRYSQDLWNSYNDVVATWPPLCKFGQFLFLGSNFFKS